MGKYKQLVDEMAIITTIKLWTALLSNYNNKQEDTELSCGAEM